MTLLRRALLPVVAVASLVPFVVTAVGQRAARWTPVFDLAMIELRVRDASRGRWPLLGLVGRIGTEEHVGSHPGPLAFYLLAPLYRLLGSTSWAYQVAALAYHGVAAMVAVLVGWRRAGAAGAAAVAVVLALLVHGLGMATLAEPWNPFLPVLWFVVCVVATWSVVAGDRPMLLLAVFAAAVCTQTHVPYLAVTTSLLGLGAVACVLGRGLDRSSVRTGLLWFGAAALLGLVLWSPPVVEQLTASPERGNLSVLVDHFGTPPEEVIGLRAGWDLLLRHLDVWHLALDAPREPGLFIGVLHRFVPSAGRGLVALVAWAVAAAASVGWLRDRRSLVSLHVVVAVAVAAAFVAMSRIFGATSYYLTLWGWTVGGFLGLATAWTVAELGLRGLRATRSVRARAGVAVALAGALVVAGLSAHLVAQPRPAVLGMARVTEQLGRLVPPTVDGLAEVDGPREGRWLVTWTDVAHLGSQGYGIVNELERAGFDVGVIEYHRWNFLAHRVRPAAEATARVHLAVGTSEVERWRAVPGAEELAYDDPLTPAQRELSASLLAEVRAQYEAAGWDDLVEKLEYDLWSAGGDPRISGLQALKLGQVRDLGVPAAVFLVPVDADP